MLRYTHLVLEGHHGCTWTHSVSFVSHVQSVVLVYLSAGVNMRSHSTVGLLQTD